MSGAETSTAPLSGGRSPCGSTWTAGRRATAWPRRSRARSRPGSGPRSAGRRGRATTAHPDERRPKRRGRRACRAAAACRRAARRPSRVDHRDRRVRGLDRRAARREIAGEGGTRRASGGSGRTRDVLGQDPVGPARVLSRQREQRVAGEELLDLLVVLRQPHSSRSAARSLRIAASVLVFTVPSGMPSSSAI